MAVQVSWPGVYIDEFAPGAPIQGVGTGTAGFVGVTAKGPLLEPTRITSFDQFVLTFGDQPLPGFYLWYAVRGFFRNGGQSCFVVRATNGQQATADATARGGGNPAVYRFTVRQAGVAGGGDSVNVDIVNAMPATPIYRPSGPLTAAAPANTRELTVATATAAFFRPGDVITVGAANERLVIAQIGSGILRLREPMVTAQANGTTVRLADLQVGDRVIRIAPAAPLGPGVLVTGSLVTLTENGNWAGTSVVSSVQMEPDANGLLPTYRVTLRDGITRAIDRGAGGGPATRTMRSEELDVTVTWKGAIRTYQRVSESAGHPRYLVDVINGDPDGPARIAVIEPPPVADAQARLLADAAHNFAGGAVEDLATLGANHLIAALDRLAAIDDVNLIAVPDRPRNNPATFVQVQQAMIAHCTMMAERFAVLDSGPGMGLFGAGSIEAHRATVDSARGYASLYYPWLRVPAADGGAPVLVPPSGHVAGIMARTDAQRGVHKAPAGEDATVRDAIGVERRMTLADQGLLNLQGVNVIQVFKDGAQPLVWGARTTATDLNWQYINVRRLFLFVEESIQDGIRWAVFEPNNLELWQKLKRSITSFLTQQWKAGALFGAKREDAFYVRIDETLNPFSEQALGRLNIEIGMRPTYPAEFIVVRIGIWDGGAEVTE